MNIGGTSIYGDDAIDRIEIADQLIHPNYDSDSLSNDVMLIKLSSPSSAPRSTWNTDDTVPGNNEELTIIGHGRTEAGTASQFLLEASVFVVDDDVCETAYARSTGSAINTDVVLCAVEDESTTCSGDSGGPVFSGSLLVGIVSFGIVSEFDGSCIANFPSGFTRVSAFSDFISTSICTLSSSPPESCFVSADLPVPVPTQRPVSRPPIRPPTRPPTISPATPRPTQIPVFPPLPFSFGFTPFTPAPTTSPTLVPSLLPSSRPSLKISSNPSSVPSMVPSFYPTSNPTNQTNDPSAFPTMNVTDARSFVPSNAPNNRDARSGGISNNTPPPATVPTIQGENRGFGNDGQSSGYRSKYGTYSMVAFGILLHGIAVIIF
jgi:hypothetical protein